MQKKVIFFDFSGVVASSGYLKWANTHIKEHPAKQKFIEDTFSQTDCGRLTMNQLDTLLSKQTGIPIQEILPAVLNDIVVDTSVVALIKKLKESYKVALLTNYSHEILDKIFERNNLTGLFDKVIVSSTHGKVKPNKDFFETALEIMQVDASEVVFIDDSAINVAGAQKVGILSFLYTTFDKLEQDLKSVPHKL